MVTSGSILDFVAIDDFDFFHDWLPGTFFLFFILRLPNIEFNTRRCKRNLLYRYFLL